MKKEKIIFVVYIMLYAFIAFFPFPFTIYLMIIDFKLLGFIPLTLFAISFSIGILFFKTIYE